MRRFISRYLVGNTHAIDLGKDTPLVYYLTRKEFWDENIEKIDNFENLLIEILKEFKLIVGQSYKFYKIIGKEDRKKFGLY